MRDLMNRNISVVQAIRDPKLLGSLFASLGSWTAWLVWLKTVVGLPMVDGDLEVYRQCTNRTDPPAGAVKEAYAIVGRLAAVPE